MSHKGPKSYLPYDRPPRKCSLGTPIIRPLYLRDMQCGNQSRKLFFFYMLKFIDE